MVALVIIYNHQYNKNIDVLEHIYAGRFSHIYHLVPFYRGNKKNVIPVYDSSYFFQGYIAQGLKSYFDEKYAHYFFVADDLVLNPVINETNYKEHLRLSAQTSFAPELLALHELPAWWPRTTEAYRWRIDTDGVEAANQLPDYDTALKKLNRFGLTIKPLRFSQIWKPATVFRLIHRLVEGRWDYLKGFMQKTFTTRPFTLTYPVVGGYADILVVDAGTIKEFTHYCGVFAATKLFVELAIPTALVFSATKIVTEKDLELQGKPLWTKEDFQELDKFDQSLKNLFREFPENYLYLHPVKLSTWNTEL